MSLLQEILEEKRREVAKLRAHRDLMRERRVDEKRPTTIWPVRNAYDALVRRKRSPLRLIAEIKFHSPSAGTLSTVMSASERALAYKISGATMISVLTDTTWFHGSFKMLERLRNLRVPLLCKDFIIDPVQIECADTSGADAVLLIARCLPDGELDRLVDETLSQKLWPVVEVTTEQELDAALRTKTKIIGVNARDLDTLEIDTDRAARVLASIPESHVAIHFSGLKTPDDVRRVAATGSDAALIGESLMREDDPTELLKSMVAAT